MIKKEYENEEKPQAPPIRSSIGPKAAAGAGQNEPPTPVQTAIGEFNAIKKALLTPEPPWVLVKDSIKN